MVWRYKTGGHLPTVGGVTQHHALVQPFIAFNMHTYAITHVLLSY